jgi:uncharacterized protein with PQ loop repeat
MSGEAMMADIVQWMAMATGIIAAVMVAGKFSARITGWGFVIFAISSIGWVAFGLLKQETPLTIQNGVLFLINLAGVWRHLVVKEKV